MADVLMIHSLNEYPTRNTLWDFLVSFKRYSQHRIWFYNFYNFHIPNYLKKIDFEVIIFHNSITLCGNRQRYIRMLNLFEREFAASPATKVALFQDEYFNTDMSVQLINGLGIHYVFSVAPRKIWPQIYEGTHPDVQFRQMLTGYINKKSDRYYQRIHDKKRTIDIGYRVVWNKPSIVLGRFGYDKIRIANQIVNKFSGKDYKLDIHTGVQFILKGKKWNDFLSSCRFILGVESGAGVLDRDGAIRKKVADAIEKNKVISIQDLYDQYVREQDHSLELRAISPRHFEAVEMGACQILYEGDYNKILKPYVHYLPLKKDYSNMDEIESYLKDENKRKEIVQRAFHDIVETDQYTYERFVKFFFEEIQIGKLPENAVWAYYFNRIAEKVKLAKIWGITCIKKAGLQQKIAENRILNPLLKKYYKKRGEI